MIFHLRRMLFLLIALLFVGVGTTEAKKKKRVEQTDERVEQIASSEVSKLIEYGKELLGRRYRSRGPGGMMLDCSGFVNYVFSRLNISLPRTSRGMSQATQRVAKSDVQVGDLLFFNGRRVGSGVGHVGMVVDVDGDDVTMIHSSTSRGIIMEKYNKSSYYTKRFVGVGRVPELKKALAQGTSAEDLVEQELKN